MLLALLGPEEAPTAWLANVRQKLAYLLRRVMKCDARSSTAST